MGRDETGRAQSPLVGNLLLVAVVVVLGAVLTTLSFAFLDGLGTPTADASFEYERTPAGLRMTPQALGTDVVVKLNGRTVETFETDQAGQSALLPTAPGDRITVVSRDGDRSVLVERTVDDRSELGDFIAYYPFEGSGSIVVDESGNGNDGTFEDDGGGSGPVRSGCGLRFDGTDDHVLVDDISAPGDVDAFTVAVAYRQQGDGSVSQLVEHTWGGGDEWFIETTDSGPGTYEIDYAVNYPGEVVSSGTSYDVGDRHVVVGTYDSDTGRYELYVDGSLKQSDAYSTTVNMGDMRLGRDFESASQYFDGTLCEVRLYYSAFDGSEVDRITAAME